MHIQYIQKRIYGRDHFYPVSPDAVTICKLTRKPTLTHHMLDVCEMAGWVVEHLECAKNDRNNNADI